MSPKDPTSSDLPDSSGRIVAVERRSIRFGPLPDPTDLAQYDQLVANGAERIMRMAQEHAAHSQALERLVVTADVAAREETSRLERRGQSLALAIGLPTLAGSVATALAGHDGVALTLAATSLVGVVAAFLGVRFGGGKPSQRGP
jgi:uncharacterized membrane protein